MRRQGRAADRSRSLGGVACAACLGLAVFAAPFTAGGSAAHAQEPPLLTLTWPNGGNRLLQGSTYTITWTSDPLVTGTINIVLLKDGSRDMPIAGQAPNIGTFPWRVLYTVGPVDSYRIRISTATPYRYRDESDRDFAVVPAIKLTAPNGGERWRRGTQQMITWRYRNSPTKGVQIDLYLRGSQLFTIAERVPVGVAGRGSYLWTIPAEQLPASRYTIRVRSPNCGAVHDYSDGPFTITK